MADKGRISKNAGSTRFDVIGSMILIAVVGAAAFWPSLDGEFLNWDDDRNFLSNEAYRGVGGEHWDWAWETYHLGVWQPLSWTLLGIEHEIAGTDAAGVPKPGIYKAFSLGLHIINGWLVFAVFVALLRRGFRGSVNPRAIVMASGAVAAIFTAHPLRVETAAWLSAQPYLPAIGFVLLSLLAYLRRYDEKGDPQRAWLAWLVVSFVCYCIACGFKAMAVTTPVLLLILDFYPLRRLSVEASRRWKRLGLIALEKVPFFVIAYFISIWAAAAKEVATDKAPETVMPLASRIAQAAYGHVFYLVKTLIPTGLSPFYELPTDLAPLAYPYSLCLLLMVFVTVICVVFARRWPYLLAAWAAYVIAVLPTSGIVQISQQLATDRYAYLATIAPLALLAALLAKRLAAVSTERSPISTTASLRTAVVVVAALVALVATSRVYSDKWDDSKTLWNAALAIDPDSSHAECQLGQAYVMENDLPEAETHFRRAVELRPDFSFAYSNLAAVQLGLSDVESAIVNYRKALESEWQMSGEDLAVTHFGLAIALHKKGDEREMWKHIREAQKLGYSQEKIAELVSRL